MGSRIKLTFLVGVLVATFAAATPVAAQSDGRVRVLHASPDAPAVDIYLDDSVVTGLTNVPFGTLSDYMPVAAGTYNVKVYATGDTSMPVIDADVTVDAGMSYTIAATGLLADIAPVVLTDDPQLSSGQSLVRIVHFSPDAPAVDIAPDGGEALIANLAFPDATDYAALEPGDYDLEVRIAGASDVALQLDPITLAPGQAYSVFAIGSAAAEPAGGNALTALVARDGVLMPDTATAPETGAASNGWLFALVLAVAGMAAVGIVLRRRPASAKR